jgi:hypothetical protein
MVFSNDVAVGVRRDLQGVLLLDTALQTPVASQDDKVRLELPLAEVRVLTCDIDPALLNHLCLTFCFKLVLLHYRHVKLIIQMIS